MDRKSKLIVLLLLLVVCLLTVLVSFATYKVATIETAMNNLANQKQMIPKVINGIDGKDGEPGLSIKGNAGEDGRNGTDSISTSTVIEKIIYVPEKGKEGSPGKDGLNAPVQEIRINPETKNLESKKNTDRYWVTMINCIDLLKVCPGEIIEEAIGKK